MSKIDDKVNIFPILDELSVKIKECKTLEQAAMEAMGLLYKEFSDTIVLARLFVAVPYGKLPTDNRSFVSELARTHNITDLINDETYVLSLLGTKGVDPAWNDRRNSKGHVGIPLASADFIDRIPMMSRLLKEVGLDLSWIDRQEAVATKTLAGLSGVFYVSDAETAVDDKGRKIISAQDFVQANKIKSVFGCAGGYPISKTFITMIVFCRDAIKQSSVEQFLPFISNFKAGTTPIVSSGAIFAS